MKISIENQRHLWLRIIHHETGIENLDEYPDAWKMALNKSPLEMVKQLGITLNKTRFEFCRIRKKWHNKDIIDMKRNPFHFAAITYCVMTPCCTPAVWVQGLIRIH